MRKTKVGLLLLLCATLAGCGGWNDYGSLIAEVKKTPAKDWQKLAVQVF